MLYLEYKYFLSTSYQLLGAAVTGSGSYWVIEHHLKETLYFQHKANCSANEKKLFYYYIKLYSATCIYREL